MDDGVQMILRDVLGENLTITCAVMAHDTKLVFLPFVNGLFLLDDVSSSTGTVFALVAVVVLDFLMYSLLVTPGANSRCKTLSAFGASIAFDVHMHSIFVPHETACTAGPETASVTRRTLDFLMHCHFVPLEITCPGKTAVALVLICTAILWKVRLPL